MKKLIITFMLVLWPCLAWGATYYVRTGGTATSLGAATGPCGTASACLRMDDSGSYKGVNDATLSSGDTIYFCDDGGDLTDEDTDNTVLRATTAGVTYTAGSGETPVIDCSAVNQGILNNVTCTISELTLKDPQNGLRGIWVSAGASSISSCTIYHSTLDGQGMYISGSGGPSISNCTLYNLDDGILADSSSATFSNNTIYDSTYGIRLSGANSNTVSANDIDNVSFGISLQNSDSNTISGNNIDDAWNDSYYGGGGDGKGIWIWGSSESNTIERNFINASYIGILNATTSGADENKAHNNVVLNSIVNGIDSQNDGGTGYFWISNNTIYHNPSASNTPSYTGHAIAVQTAALKAKISNNIIAMGSGCAGDTDCNGVVIDDPGTVIVWLDYNNYFNDSGGTVVYGRINSTNYTSLSAWQTAIQADAEVTDRGGTSNQAEANAIDGDPLFLNAGGTSAGNYKISYVSPAKNVGTDLSGAFTSDYRGNLRPKMGAYDIGAYELNFIDSPIARDE